MNWDAIGAIGEMLGAAAVFLSLLYLALQIRANTSSAETASRQSVANEFREWVRTNLNPEHFSAGLSDYPDIPFRARFDFCTQMHDLVLFYQSAQAMHESGALPDESHEPYRTWVAAVLNTPGGRNFWSEWEGTYNVGMTTSLAQKMRDPELPNPLEFPMYQLDENHQAS